MIKTTSFALSRPAHTASGSSSRTRQQVIKTAKARAMASSPVQPDLGSLFAAPIAVPEISAAQAREIIQGSAPKNKTKTKAVPSPTNPSAVPLSVSEVEITMPSTSSAPLKTPRATKRKTSASAPTEAPILADPVEVVPEEAVSAVAEKTETKKAGAEVKKSRRPRVPANLAEQYGQSLSRRVENGAEAVSAEDESPKKRLSRAERQARRELMNPDDDLLARLHRVHNSVPTTKPEKRPRGWRFDCGRCGQTSYFQTGGAICSCGALAIKE